MRTWADDVENTPVLLDIGDGDQVDTRCAAVAAHILPRPLEDVSAIDLVPKRVEPSPGIGLGRPVQRMLQTPNRVHHGPRSGETSRCTHRAPPRRAIRTDEAAALPSPTVVMSARLQQYYGRLRRPPGATSTSRCEPVIGPASSLTTRRSPAGEGLPSARRHYLNVPRPLRRRVLGGCDFRFFTASMAFTVVSAARLPLLPPFTRAGPLTTLQASLHAADRPVAPPKGPSTLASTRTVSNPTAKSATGLLTATRPDSHRQATSTNQQVTPTRGTSSSAGARKIEVNGRLRKTLGWQTPVEVFAGLLERSVSQ